MTPGDAARAARWLDAVGAAIPSRGAAPRALAQAALGSAICAVLLRAGEHERAAQAAVARLRAAADGASDAALNGCDPLVLALVARLSGDPALARHAARLVAAAPLAPARRALAARVLDDRDDGAPRTVPADETTDVAILTADEAALHALCDAVEACGLRDRDAAERERIGAALGARAFAALRASRGFELGLRLLRVVAGERLDATAVAEGLAYLRRQQRIDGSFGHLPPRSAQAGDIRLAFHLPRTVTAVWLLHDALQPEPLVRRALRAPALAEAAR